MRISPWRRFQRLLLTGLFVVLPFSVTFIVITWFVGLIEGALAPVIVRIIGRPVPGLGVILAFVITMAAGFLGTNIVGQHLLEILDDAMLHIPGLNWIYRTLKQLSEVFAPTSKQSFRSVVLVEYPRPHVWSVGFVTNQLTLERGSEKKTLVSVYVPTNHMYIGDYILVPTDQLVPTRLTQQEGIQAAISAGASLPSVLKAHDRLGHHGEARA